MAHSDVVTAATNAPGSAVVTTTYIYDALSRLRTSTDPLSYITRYAYDALGQRTVLTDANSDVTRYTYDVAGRLTVVSYTGEGRSVQYQYNALGQRLAMTDTMGMSHFGR